MITVAAVKPTKPAHPSAEHLQECRPRFYDCHVDRHQNGRKKEWARADRACGSARSYGDQCASGTITPRAKYQNQDKTCIKKGLVIEQGVDWQDEHADKEHHNPLVSNFAE